MTRIISSPQRDILPLRSISPDWYMEHVSPSTAPTALDLRKRADVDGGAIGQRYHWADTGGRHQAPAHSIIPQSASKRRCRMTNCSRSAAGQQVTVRSDCQVG